MTRPSIVPVLVLSILAAVSSRAATREVTFEDRVRAQEAIERVRYSHQINAAKPFAEAIPRALLESKVRDYLRQSAALETYWKTPITDEMLQHEVERMVAATRMPDRLSEMFAVLGNDPILVKECLARPTLAERLAHESFANDATIHARAREEAERLSRHIATGAIDAAGDLPRGALLEYSVGNGKDEAPTRAGDPYRVHLSTDEMSTMRTNLAAATVQNPLLEETREHFTIAAMLANGPETLRVARYVVPKTDWSSWWATVAGTLDATLVKSVARADIALPVIGLPASAFLPCAAGDSWDNGALGAVPVPRMEHTLVWTGTYVVVWGGTNGDYLKSGSRYDPAIDAWLPMTLANAPLARSRHTAIWTGSEMVVWGGYDGLSSYSTGGRYNPNTDTWSLVSDDGAPARRYLHTAVWTGTDMIVWGGTNGGTTGGRYNVASDTWVATSTTGAPSARQDHTAVWTGSRMVVWGGGVNTGGRYDPATDSWQSTTTTNAPSARRYHAAVWTGSSMIVWGGFAANVEATGARYDPVADSWTATSTLGAPSARDGHTYAWTGSELIVWAGALTGGVYTNTGGRYNPGTDTWAAMTVTGAPSGRRQVPAVWTGSRFITWGGMTNGNGYSTDSGGKYDPVADTWAPTFSTGAPAVRSQHAAIWTGNVMVVWGGLDFAISSVLSTGGRYDPALDTWSSTTTLNAPSSRAKHTAIWTGSKMIVWGGNAYSSSTIFNSGGRYDPVADSWTSTSLTNAPEARSGHTAVWSGTVMVVWGGNAMYTGGRYDPLTDTWAATASNGPVGRSGHTAVWTGSRMLVWGGNRQISGPNNPPLATGGSYDPATNQWTEISTAGAPAADGHTAVWTGSKMVVWGGDGTAGRYDPATDTWEPATTYGEPLYRRFHTAVWTGSRMIVWGGLTGDLRNYTYTMQLRHGSRYDPIADAWSPTTDTGAPQARYYHSAVWTGSFMIVWGGYSGSQASRNGGRYEFEAPFDNDGDGFSGCQGDCNDGNAAVNPSASELCDGADNDCDGLVDDGVTAPTLYRDLDGDGFGNPSQTVRSCVLPAGYSPHGTDCNDGDVLINPLAEERCNGIDDDCDVDIDEGITAPDESPAVRLSKVSGGTVTWQPIVTATHYDVVKGDLVQLLTTSGDFTAATLACVEDDTTSTSTVDTAVVPAGGFWYLVRPINCGGVGGYDSGSPAQSGSREAEIAAAGGACP